MSASQSLRKLSLVLLTQYKKSDVSDQQLNDPKSPIYLDSKLFEVISMVHTEDRLKIPMLLWEDLEPNRKVLLRFPIRDLGLDYVSTNLQILGQAKCYSSNRVAAAKMNRTLHCALIITITDKN